VVGDTRRTMRKKICRATGHRLGRISVGYDPPGPYVWIRYCWCDIYHIIDVVWPWVEPDF
jgi:hypothetical protein